MNKSIIRNIGILGIFLFAFSNQSIAQNTAEASYENQFLQTIRGQVKDADSNISLIGASIIIVNSSPIVGTATNTNGEFRLEGIPVGRITLEISYIGYETIRIQNIVLTAGKESVVNIELQEATGTLATVELNAHKNAGEHINELALLSAQSISVEEMNRLSTGFNDPALITTNYAGVSTTGNGGNDIIIRGNSPKYIQWRLEGMPIATPNHFADQGSLNGTTSMLNSNLLNSSDFYTGAFQAEYGEALSGIYDIRLRSGNNEKRETIIGVGLLGTDITLEGPLKKGYRGSYLFNYRYSTAASLNKLELIDVKGDPIFQDAAFKFDLPSENWGNFTVYGLAGHSSLDFEELLPEDWNTPKNNPIRENISQDFNKTSYLLNLGITHQYALNDRGFIKSQLAMTMDGIEDNIYETNTSTQLRQKSYTSDLQRNVYRMKMSYHHKLNRKHKLQTGSIYTLNKYKHLENSWKTSDYNKLNIIDIDENIGLLRNYISWRYRASKKLSLVAGLHNTNVFYNNKHTVEPRVAARWNLSKKGSLSAAYGLHSSMESLHHYFVKTPTETGGFELANKDLDLLKAHHFVLGYEHRFRPQLIAKAELYYQNLYDLPVSTDPEKGYFATINEDLDAEYTTLANHGTGKNYGMELSLQRYFADDYYFIANASIYESKYTAKDGVERDTRYNGNYTLNFIAGKEFYALGKKRNKTLGINAKLQFAGGKKIIPLLKDANGNATVDPLWDYERAYENSLEDIYQLTISASYRWEKSGLTQELLLNLENITDNKGKLSEYYDAKAANGVGYDTQFGLLPNLMYKIYF